MTMLKVIEVLTELYPNSEILTHGAQRCAGMIAL